MLLASVGCVPLSLDRHSVKRTTGIAMSTESGYQDVQIIRMTEVKG